MYRDINALDFFKGANSSCRFHEFTCEPVSALCKCLGTEYGSNLLFGSSILRIAPLLHAASRRTTNSKPSLETSVTYLDSPGASLEAIVLSCRRGVCTTRVGVMKEDGVKRKGNSRLVAWRHLPTYRSLAFVVIDLKFRLQNKLTGVEHWLQFVWTILFVLFLLLLCGC